MKSKIISVLLTVMLFLIIFFIIFGNRINYPFILSKVGINLAISSEGEGCPESLIPGYYDITSSNNTNIYNGITIGKASTIYNIPSSDIKSVAQCEGNLKFSPTDLNSVDFKGQNSFDVNPGYYKVGENIDPGKYKLTVSLNKGERLYTNYGNPKENIGNEFNISEDGEYEIDLPNKANLKIYVFADNILGTDEIKNSKIHLEKIS